MYSNTHNVHELWPETTNWRQCNCFPVTLSLINGKPLYLQPLLSIQEIISDRFIRLICNNYNFVAATSIEPETFWTVRKCTKHSSPITPLNKQRRRLVERVLGSILVAVSEAQSFESIGESWARGLVYRKGTRPDCVPFRQTGQGRIVYPSDRPDFRTSIRHCFRGQTVNTTR
jgi:hypothetical protein